MALIVSDFDDVRSWRAPVEDLAKPSVLMLLRLLMQTTNWPIRRKLRNRLYEAMGKALVLLAEMDSRKVDKDAAYVVLNILRWSEHDIGEGVPLLLSSSGPSILKALTTVVFPV